MSLPAPKILTWLLNFWKYFVPLTTNMFKEWEVQEIILKTTVTITAVTVHYQSPTCCATESLNRTSDSHINFPTTTFTLRNIVLCMSPLFETPQIIKKKEAVCGLPGSRTGSKNHCVLPVLHMKASAKQSSSDRAWREARKQLSNTARREFWSGEERSGAEYTAPSLPGSTWRCTAVPDRRYTYPIKTNTRLTPVSFNSGRNAVTSWWKYSVCHHLVYRQFAKLLWKATVCHVTSVCPSAYSHVTTRILWKGFSWHIMLGIFTQFCRHIRTFAQLTLWSLTRQYSTTV